MPQTSTKAVWLKYSLDSLSATPFWRAETALGPVLTSHDYSDFLSFLKKIICAIEFVGIHQLLC